jgi:cyclopropane fatty-acyl-phospholipid synthase-like methyltransferase
MPSTTLSALEYSPILSESFDSWYKAGRDMWSDEPVMRTLVDPILKMNARGLRILDIGAGRGADAIKLAKAGHRVTALDLCRVPEWDDIEASFSGRIEFSQCDFLEWQDDKAFDIFFDNGCFHHQHIGDIPKYLRRLGDALIDGGLFLLSVFHETSTDLDAELTLTDGRIVRIYSRETLLSTLKNYGLAIAETSVCVRNSAAFPYDYLHVLAKKEQP